MRNFIFGVLATVGASLIGNKLYNKGYDDAKDECKKKDEKSSKDKKAK